jgi:hypothetical protein
MVYIGASLGLNLHQIHIVSILLIFDGFRVLGSCNHGCVEFRVCVCCGVGRQVVLLHHSACGRVVAGHGMATVLAVLGGLFPSEYVSEKLIAYVGGNLFLVFAASSLINILK